MVVASPALPFASSSVLRVTRDADRGDDGGSLVTVGEQMNDDDGDSVDFTVVMKMTQY